MSDLYDSLEDDDNLIREPFDNVSTKFSHIDEGIVRSAMKESIDERKPFFLERDEEFEEDETQVPLYLSPNDLTTKNHSQVKSFLPKVDNDCKKYGPSSASFNLIVDNEELTKKGLQWNKDGSFTKSPRFEEEQLPFVNPVYKNLEIQKLKPPELRKKTRFCKKNRKNIFTFKDHSKDEISMMGIIKARGPKGSSEEILTSGGSYLSFKDVNLTSVNNFEGNDNLTDSMKEMMMLQKQNGKNNAKRKQRASEQVRKSKQVKPKTISNKSPHPCSSKTSLKQTLPNVTSYKKEIEVYPEENNSKQITSKKLLPRVDEAITKRLTSPVLKQRSDILLSYSKPRLSYLERHQRESGFNPLYLRYGVKKIPSDTNRSNFGDSVAEKLSEFSTRLNTCSDITDDEDEEMFYRRLMEKDKNKQWAANRTSRSEVQSEKEKCGHFSASNSCKNQKELERSDKFYAKQKLKKSTSIDMPATSNASLNPTKKYSHYCSVNVSSGVSKTELALKAKAYGYMANARNIFKMKTQSEAKLVSNKTETCNSRGTTSTKVLNHQTRQNESSEEGSQLDSNRLARTSKSLCKPNKYENHLEKEIVLPEIRIRYSDAKEQKYKSEVLKRIRSCLNGAGSPRTLESSTIYGNMKELQKKYVDNLPRFKCL